MAEKELEVRAREVNSKQRGDEPLQRGFIGQVPKGKTKNNGLCKGQIRKGDYDENAKI